MSDTKLGPTERYGEMQAPDEKYELRKPIIHYYLLLTLWLVSTWGYSGSRLTWPKVPRTDVFKVAEETPVRVAAA